MVLVAFNFSCGMLPWPESHVPAENLNRPESDPESSPAMQGKSLRESGRGSPDEARPLRADIRDRPRGRAVGPDIAFAHPGYED